LKLRALAALLFVAAFTGCATHLSYIPPAPGVALQQSSKVGLLVALDSTAKHVHVGTTVFNNFTRDWQLPFDLAAHAGESFAGRLRASGFKVVRLDPAVVPPREVDALIVPEWGEWQENPEQAAILRSLKDEQGLAALVVVHGERIRRDPACAGGPCSEFVNLPTGLYTRSYLTMRNFKPVQGMKFKAVADIETRVFLLSPPADLSVYEPFAGVARNRVIDAFVHPADYRNMSSEELQPVADWIRTYVDRMAEETAVVLAGR